MGDVKALINQLFGIENFFFFKLSSFGLDPGQDGRFLIKHCLMNRALGRPVTGDMWEEIMVAQQMNS